MTAPRPRIPVCLSCSQRHRRYPHLPVDRRTEIYPRRQRHWCWNGAPLCGRDGVRWDET